MLTALCILVGLGLLAQYFEPTIHWLGWIDDADYYSQEYKLKKERIAIEREPHDCEFWRAPVGKKYCSYEKKISACGPPKNAPAAEQAQWKCVDDGDVDTKLASVGVVYISWEKKQD